MNWHRTTPLLSIARHSYLENHIKLFPDQK